MENRNKFLEKWRGPLVLSFVLILIFSGIVGYMLLDFNNKEIEVTQNSENSKVSVSMDIDCTKTERWNSSLYTVDSPDTYITFWGETINGSIINNNSFAIRQWSLRIAPKNECYINGFWGGSIEVHQFRNGEEIIEKVDSIVSNSDISLLEVNPYIDAMMIRLMPGDYFIFEPSYTGDIDVIKAGDTASVVFNIYYVEPLDFSGYSLIYRNDIKIRESWIHPLLIILWGIWFFGFMVFIAAAIVNNRMRHDFNNSAQSIQAMTDLYLETYIIELDKQVAHLIKGDADKTLFKFSQGLIQENLYQYVSEDCVEAYVEDIKLFLDLNTIVERLKDTSSIVFEYISKSKGWCSIRIFKIECKKESKRLILAIQDINEERRRLHEIEDNIRQKENDVIIQGDFLNNTFFAMNELVNVIRETSGKLSHEIGDSNQRMMALSINDSIEHLHLLKNCIYDLFALDTDRFVLKSEIYNVNEIAEKLKSILTPFYMGKNYEFQIDIDPDIPEKLRGDKERLMQILVVLLFSSLFVTEKGFVKLSVYGKRTGSVEELVFSVRDSAIGFTEEQVIEIQEIFREEKLTPVDNASLVYLQIMHQILRKMNSEMKLVSVYGSGSEFYFSLEQEVVND